MKIAVIASEVKDERTLDDFRATLGEQSSKPVKLFVSLNARM